MASPRPAPEGKVQRVLEYHQTSVSEYVHKHSAVVNNEKAFRQSLTSGIDNVPAHLRWREREPRDETPRGGPAAEGGDFLGGPSASSSGGPAEPYLINQDLFARRRGPLAVGGTPVPPVFRLRRPALPKGGKSCPPVLNSGALQGGGSSSSSAPPPGRPKASSRQLPPIVYDHIDQTLTGGRLPPAWFNDRPKLHDRLGGREGGARTSRAATASPLLGVPPPGSGPPAPASARGPRPRGGGSPEEKEKPGSKPLSGSLSRMGSEEVSSPPAAAAPRHPAPEAAADDSADISGQEEGVEIFNPPLLAKSLYFVPGPGGGHQEWRTCEVLAYGNEEQQYLIRWKFGNFIQKRVSALQLVLDGESIDEGLRRHAEAKQRRDTVEAMLLETILVDELSRWQVGSEPSQAVRTSGGSMQRIMELAQLKRYQASEEVVNGLVGEAMESYSRAQAKSVLLWQRPDLEEYLGLKLAPPASQRRENLVEDFQSSSASYADSGTVSPKHSVDGEASPSARAEPQTSTNNTNNHNNNHNNNSNNNNNRKNNTNNNSSTSIGGEQNSGSVQSLIRIKRGPGGLRGNLKMNAKFHSSAAPDILQQGQELGEMSLYGSAAGLRRIQQVMDICGKISCGGDGIDIYCPLRKREPYSLKEIMRSLSDGFARSNSMYRITWPEKVTQFFIEPTGTASPFWDERMSNLIARRMEACLHGLCLKNLRQLVHLAGHYAELSKAIREQRLSLTYVPPAVYQRTQATSYEQHPLFRIQVLVGRAGQEFSPACELAVEAFFASSDTKTMEAFIQKKRLREAARQVRRRFYLEEEEKRESGLEVKSPPDGGTFGGAPTAVAIAIQKGVGQFAAQLSTSLGCGDPGDEMEDDDDPPSDEEEQVMFLSSQRGIFCPATRNPRLLKKATAAGTSWMLQRLNSAREEDHSENPVLFEDGAGDIVVKMTAHPVKFREVLGAHFRKIVELTEKFSTIDSYLQHDGEVAHKSLSSLTDVHAEAVKSLETQFNESLTSCFFDGHSVVHEVAHYRILLQRFGGLERQLRKMLYMPRPSAAPREKAEPEAATKEQATEAASEGSKLGGAPPGFARQTSGGRQGRESNPPGFARQTSGGRQGRESNPPGFARQTSGGRQSRESNPPEESKESSKAGSKERQASLKESSQAGSKDLKESTTGRTPGVASKVREFRQRLDKSFSRLRIRKSVSIDEVHIGSDTESDREQPAKTVEDHPDIGFLGGVARSIPEVKEQIDRIDAWATELKETQELPERHLGLFVIDVSPLRKALLAMCACCRLRLLGCVQRWLEEECAQLMAALQVKSVEIIMNPNAADELLSTLEACDGLEVFLEDKRPVLANIRDMFQLLQDCNHQVPSVLQKRWYDCIHAVPDIRDRAERWRALFRREIRGRFNLKIAGSATLLKAQCEECRLILEEWSCKVVLKVAESCHTNLTRLNLRIGSLQVQVKKQHLHEQMMEMPLSDFTGLNTTAEQITPLLELWYMAHEWNLWKEEIVEGEFARIDPVAVKQKLSSCMETMKRLEEVFSSQPRPRQVLQLLSIELTELRVLLPVIVSLRNPGLRDRHLVLIGEAIEQNIQASQMKDISLKSMNERYPFVAHLAQIQAISETAAKEMVIEGDLRRFQEQWGKMPFKVFPIGQQASDDVSTGEPDSPRRDLDDDVVVLMADFQHAEVWELITEQMSKVRLLCQSAHAGVHAQALVKHDEKLKAIGDLCDLLHESQHGYLCAREQLLPEGMVKELMQKDTERNKEMKRFLDIDKQWQTILLTLRSQPSWLALLDVPKILITCREAAAGMERIQRSLHEVLDMRRSQVPHLYRLSDAQLMRVLRYGQDPAEPAIRCCLPGVFVLDVIPHASGHPAIRGHMGDCGEYLALPQDMPVKEGTPIEVWLPRLFDMIEMSLRLSLVSLSTSDFTVRDVRLLDERYPLQVRSAALDVSLTAMTERALSEPSQCKTFFLGQRKELADCIQMLHGKRMLAADRAQKGDDFESLNEETSEEDDGSAFEDSEGSSAEDGEEDESDLNEDDHDEAQEGGGKEDGEPDGGSPSDDNEAGSNAENKGSGDETSHAQKSFAKFGPRGQRGSMARQGSMARGEELTAELLALSAPSGAKELQPRMMKPNERRRICAQRMLTDRQLYKTPWRLYQFGATNSIQQLLRWRDTLDTLELESNSTAHPVNSHRWLTSMRHYLAAPSSHSGARDAPMSAAGCQYTLAMAGFDLCYGWQYLGGVGSGGRLYWDPQTARGQLAVAHAFATRRGVLATGPNAEVRGEPASCIARALGIVEDRCFVNWRSSHSTIWKNVAGAFLSGTWLSLVIDPSAHVHILAVLAQDLHSYLNILRSNLHKEAVQTIPIPVLGTGWVNLECQQSQLRDQRLPMLLLQTFRPTGIPEPNTQALCELWLMSSGLAPQHCKVTARTAAYAWRFCEETGLLDWISHRHSLVSRVGAPSGQNLSSCKSLWQLRLLCDMTAKIILEARKGKRSTRLGRTSMNTQGRRGSVEQPSKGIEQVLGDEKKRALSVSFVNTARIQRQSTFSSGAEESLRRQSSSKSAELLRRQSTGTPKAPSSTGPIPDPPAKGSVEAERQKDTPVWARAAVGRALQALFDCDQGLKSECVAEICKLLNVSDEDMLQSEYARQSMQFESRAEFAFRQLGLAPSDSQTRAVVQMNSWLSLGNVEHDAMVGMPPTRAVLVLGATATGKSVCVDALTKWSQVDHSGTNAWELRRLNTTSLALDAADALLRPTAGTAKISSEDVDNAGILQDALGSGTNSLKRGQKVLVHVDGEIGPSMQSNFLAALSEADASGYSSTRRRGLHLSSESWLALPLPTADCRLGLVFEMGADASRSLGPDLVSRCGVVYLGEGEHFAEEMKFIISGWVTQVSELGDEVAAQTVQKLAEAVLAPLLMLLYGDADKDNVETIGCADAIMRAKRLLGPANGTGRRGTVRNMPRSARQASLRSLQGSWGLPRVPRRVALLRVREAFMALFGHWLASREVAASVEQGRRPSASGIRMVPGMGAPGLNRRERISFEHPTEIVAPEAPRASTLETLGFEPLEPSGLEVPAPAAKARPTLKKGLSFKIEAEADDSPGGHHRRALPLTDRENSTGTPRSKLNQQNLELKVGFRVEQQAAPGLRRSASIGPASKDEKELQMSTEATVAFIFAITSGLSAFLTETGLPMLEEAVGRLLEAAGGVTVRLPSEYSIFDSVPDESLRHLQHMDNVLKTPDTADLDAYVFVPTISCKRFLALASILRPSKTHIALLGPPGCGKTSMLSWVMSELPMQRLPPALPAAYATHRSPVRPHPSAEGVRAELLYMSASQWTPPGRWERLLQRPLTRSSQHSLRPRLFSWCLFVVDDCHCAPMPLSEAWRFAMERGLVHSPGACAAPAAQGLKGRPAAQGAAAGGASPNRRVAERFERQVAPPAIRKMEGVMLILAARKASSLLQKQSLMRHTWHYTMDPLGEADILKIIGDNMSHFVYVNDLSADIVAEKMQYVRLVHGWYLKLQAKESATVPTLTTPHVLFRFFKSLLCLPTEWLCDLPPSDFHALLLHELMRETIDRLPAPSCQGAALKELAKLQISHFGGLDEVGRLVAKQSTMVPILSEPGVLGEDFGEDEDDFGKDEGEAGEKEEHGDTANQAPRQAAISQNNQLEPVLEKLKSIRFSHLRSRPAQAPSGVKEMGMPARNVEKTTTYNDCTDSFDELCDSIRKDVHHGLRTNIKKAPEADTSEHCSSLLLALPLWSGQRDRARASQMLEHQLTFAIFADASSVQEGGLQLEPRIALFSNEYIREMLTLSRLLDVASGQSRSQVWGRNGGKTLLLTPCVAAAISLLRGLAFLLPNVTADTPFGLPGGDGTSALGSSMAGSFSSMVLSGGAPGALGDGPTELAEVLLPDDLRGWLKERLMHAVTDDASAILILPPSVIDHPELLAVLHEAFSLAGPPDGWFSEKEIRDCEAAVESLEPTQRLLPPTMYQEDENNHVLPWMDQFWAEALGRTHFVFLARALYEEGRLPLRCHVTTELLDTQYPGFLQQMAVVQMEHLSRETFVSAAKAHLSSPVLEPESWQPDTPLKAVISTDALSEAATSLIEAVRRIAADPPPGFAPKNFRQPPDLSRRPGPTAGDCENSIPKIGQNCSGWSGEGTDSGLGAREASIADLGDLLALTQNLCGLKGRELAKQHRDLKNAHKLLEELQKDLVNTSAEEVERQLAEITDRSQKAKELADLKKQEYNNRKASLAELVSEVIDRCSQARTKYGAAETLCQETSRELEMNRMQLISFSKVDQAELRNLLKQHLPAGDLTPRSPTVALFEMCAIALRVSAKPSRDAARTAMSNPLFTTKLAGVDTDALTAEHIEGMSESLSIAGGPADFADTKSLFMIANVVFPAYHMAATKLKLPAMQKELDRLLEIRVKRTVEVEDMQDQVNDLADESKDLQQRSQNLQKEVAKQHQVVGANKERRERMEKLSGLTRHDRWRWSWLIDDLSDRLEDLVGDCLLSAAAALFMGPLGPDHRQQLLGHWKDCLEQLGVQHSHKFDICWYWVPATARSRWRSELGVPPDRHLEESLVLSTLQAVSWPLFYDPDGIAVNILLQFYPGATSISMGTPDFRDKLLHAIQTSATFEKNAKQAPGEAPGAAGGPRKPDVADPLVVIIDNTYLPALREIDLLTELLPRKQLRAAACATKGAAIPLMYFSGEENTVQVDPKLVLLFVTRSAEPLARDLLSYQFQVIDFRVCVEAESQVSQEMLSALIFRRTQPTVHAEWKQLQPERAALIDEWARLDEDVIAKLGAHLKAKQKDKHDSYPTGEHVRDMMTLKATANDVGRRLLKSKDAEAKLLQARTPHEPLAVMLASLASACQDLRWICPSLNISFGSFLNLVEESLPPLPAENTRSARDKKAEVTDLDWGVIARQAVVSALSRHCQAAVPENLVLPVAVRIAVAASIPNKGLQEIISKLLLQCPASDLACLGVELSKQTHQAIEALLDGEPVSRVVKFLDQLPARKFSRERMGSGSPCGDQDQLFPPSPSRTLRRAMTSKLGSPNSSRDALEEWNSGHDVETRERGFKHGKTRSVGQTLAPPTMLASSPHGSRTPSRNSLQETASLQRSRSPSPSPSVASHYENCDALSEVAVLPRRTGLLRTSQTSVNLGQSSQDDGKEPEVKLQYSSPTLMRQLFVSADHWEPCSTKPVFLARFCYFQDALRLLLHKAAGNSHNFGYSTGTAAAAALALFPVQDLFRMSRVENFAKLPSDFDIMEKSFGIQRMNTGELSLSMNSRRDSRSHQGNPGQGILRRDSRLFKPALGEKEGVGDEQAKKTRTADAGGEHEEGAGDNSTDVLQVLSIMGQFTALGGLRNPVLSVEVDWVFLRGTIDRLLESVGADADKWACWADNVARGELKAEPKEPGSASTAFGTGLGNWGTGPMEQLPLLTSVPLDLLTAFLPLTTNGFPTLTLQQTSALNVVQVLLLLVLLSHSLVALLAGLEAISGELAPSRGASHLEALLNHSSPLQPVVCLCESAASSVQDTIVALASQQKGGRKVVHVALTGVVINPWASNQSTQGIGWSGVGPVAAAARPMSQIAELLEESLEEGQWLVLSLLPGGAPGLGADDGTGVSADLWDTFEILERVWYQCGGMRRDNVDDRFRIFVVVDARVPHCLPRWVFDGQCVSYFDSQTGTSLRHWFGRFLETLRKRDTTGLPSGIAASIQGGVMMTASSSDGWQTRDASTVRELFAESQMSQELRLNRDDVSNVLNTQTYQPHKPTCLRSTSLRLLTQLLLAALAAGERGVVGSPSALVAAPGIGNIESKIADEIVCDLIRKAVSPKGADLSDQLRLADLIEVVATLTLRQDGGMGSDRLHVGNHGLIVGRMVYNLMAHLRSQVIFKRKASSEVAAAVARWGSAAKDEKTAHEASNEEAARVDPSRSLRVAKMGRMLNHARTVAKAVTTKRATTDYFGDDNGEEKEVPWFLEGQPESTLLKPSMAFSKFAEAVDRLMTAQNEKGGPDSPLIDFHLARAEGNLECLPLLEQKVLKALTRLPLVDPKVVLHLSGANRAVCLMSLIFSSPLRSFRLPLPELPETRHSTPQSSEQEAPRSQTTAARSEDAGPADVVIVVDRPVSDSVSDEVTRDAGKTEVDLSDKQSEGSFGSSGIAGTESAAKEESREEGPCLSPDSQGVLRSALASIFEAAVLCVEACPLHTSNGFNPDNGTSLAADSEDGVESTLQAEWRRQRHAVALWAASVLEEATMLRRGLSEGLDVLSPRLLLKLRHLLHCLQSRRAVICPASVRNTSIKGCPLQVWEAAASAEARALPVPCGWDQPGFQKQQSFGHWLHATAVQLYQVYAPPVMPNRLRVSSLARVAPLFGAMRLELAGKLRVGVESICLIFEPTSILPGRGQDDSESPPDAEQIEQGTWDELDDELKPSYGPNTQVPVMLGMFSSVENFAGSAEESIGEAASPTAGASPQSRRSSGLAFAASPQSRRSSGLLGIDRSKTSDTLQSPAGSAAASPTAGTSPQSRRSSGLIAASPTSGASPQPRRSSAMGRSKTSDTLQSPAGSAVRFRTASEAVIGVNALVRKKSSTAILGVRGKLSAIKQKKDTRPNQFEIGKDELILTGLLVDGAVWSATGGLYVDRAVPGLTRLPPMRVRAATPHVAEMLVHLAYPQAHGCLSLPVQRILGSSWPVQTAGGSLSGEAESAEFFTVRLPFTWAKNKNACHPVTILDGFPPRPPLGHLCSREHPEDVMGGLQLDEDQAGLSLEYRVKAPLLILRPFGLHPCALPTLTGSPAPPSSADVPAPGSTSYSIAL